MMAPDNTTFEGARVIPAANGENTAQLYQRFLESWYWRARQMKGGAFEVVLEGIPAEDDDEIPVNGLAPETLNEAYNDYRSLAGWGSKS